ncbi:MAG: orotidine-5'-phosphate decarboxylase [Candidatus Aminicenantes bacterium]|nr:orotidine-5'-phosphate decarboxylase [Candidatus Aminicenantes bacterium]
MKERSSLESMARKIIIALDVKDGKKALALVKALPEAQIFKVGLRLFIAEGPSLLEKLKKMGKSVFLDLKLHDIPNTVAGAIESAVLHGAHMITLHAAGGREMMTRAAEEAALNSKAHGKEKPLLLAVTVLTSLKPNSLEEVGMNSDIEKQVLILAHLAQAAGMDGIICSPQELEFIKKEFPENFLAVTPGIRPLWASPDDQKRIMTPSQALNKGADYIVIGRPVIAAPDPQESFQRILQEISDRTGL